MLILKEMLTNTKCYYRLLKLLEPWRTRILETVGTTQIL